MAKILVHSNAGPFELACEQQQRVFHHAVNVHVAHLFGAAIQAQHLPHDTRHALRLGFQNFVNRPRLRLHLVGKQEDAVLNRFHGIVHLMGDGAGQATRSGKLFHFQHAPLQPQLLQTAHRSQVAQYGHGVGDQAAFIVNLAGARIVFHL